MKKFFILAILLTGCPTISKEREESLDAERIRNLEYFKDPKTNLCFAARSLGYYSAVLTNVPCTPEVERFLIIK